MIIMKWIRDEEFARGGKIPMTKFETRVLTLTLLNIGAGDVFWDIGAGTGSIAAQAALLGAEVYAVEREAEGADVNVTRTVYRNGAVYFQDYFNTHYQPWRAVYEYGPGTEIPDSDGE